MKKKEDNKYLPHNCCARPTCDVSMSPPYLNEQFCYMCGKLCGKCLEEYNESESSKLV